MRQHCDDDREVKSTAGPPILARLVGEDLVQTVVVVTRFYGGTQLGRGGLVRAYGAAASAGLEAAEVKVVRCCWSGYAWCGGASRRFQPSEGCCRQLVCVTCVLYCVCV